MNQEEMKKVNIERIEIAKEEYKSFQEDYKKNKCYLCGSNLDYFNQKTVCLHWLLYPLKIKKKNFNNFFKIFDLFQINSYLMWVAYQENKSTNINNLEFEKDKNKLWETTIKYKNIKWSLTCADSDFTGHKESKVNFPHYHFLMEVNKRPFISFNDFHIPLTKGDILKIKAHNKPFGNYIHFWYIPGMEEMFKGDPNKLLEKMKTQQNKLTAPFHLIGIFEMGRGISREEIYNIMTRSKETGESVIKGISKIPNLKSNIFIEPGEGVPQLDKKLSRSQKRRKK